MVSYDRDTQAFIEKIADGHIPSQKLPTEDTQKEKDRTAELVLRAAKRSEKIIANPKKAIPKTILRLALRELIKKEGSATVLVLYQELNDSFARDWHDWEPETLWVMLKDKYGEGVISDEFRNLVMALQVSVNTLLPFELWHIFEKVAQAFSENIVNFSVMQPLEIEEAVLAMNILKRIQPKAVFEPEVLIYIAACAKHCGMAYLPEELAPEVQPELDKMTFEHELRDNIKKAWENKSILTSMQSQAIEVGLQRCQDIKDLLDKEGVLRA